ncbi:malonyl-ACP O-methyltransferase BioC [Mariniblastus sp.]|nr:malonyl-ACP O-methyltransferase BioC [Mariniblastus sp.]
MKLAKDQIARQFSRAATTYDAAAQLQNEMAEILIDAIPNHSQGTLVDLGCGTGWPLQQLARSCKYEMTAIDLAPGMIKIARQKTPQINFICCDLESTPLPDDFANVVFSNAAIQWCNTAKALTEISRIAKPKANLLLSTFGPSTFVEISSAWEEIGDSSDRIHQFENPQTIQHLLEDLNLEDIAIQQENRQLIYHSVDDLFRGIRNLGATNASSNRRAGLLGKERYRQFKAVFENRLAQNNQLELTFDCIFVVAKTA